MDMPDLYYWVATVWTLCQMLKELFAWLKENYPKLKRRPRNSKRRKLK